MEKANLLLGLLISCSVLAGCASTGGVSDPAETNEDGLQEPSVNSGYFSATRDLRKCAAPDCGGWFVRSVNEATTECADGTTAESCYVASIDVAAIGLSAREQEDLLKALESGRALVKARLEKQTIE